MKQQSQPISMDSRSIISLFFIFVLGIKKRYLVCVKISFLLERLLLCCFFNHLPYSFILFGFDNSATIVVNFGYIFTSLSKVSIINSLF